MRQGLLFYVIRVNRGISVMLDLIQLVLYLSFHAFQSEHPPPPAIILCSNFCWICWNFKFNGVHIIFKICTRYVCGDKNACWKVASVMSTQSANFAYWMKDHNVSEASKYICFFCSWLYFHWQGHDFDESKQMTIGYVSDNRIYERINCFFFL